MSRKPKATGKGAEDREARLKAALKANLGRRKAQANVRGTGKTKNEKAG
jgi:hypothetical protein